MSILTLGLKGKFPTPLEAVSLEDYAKYFYFLTEEEVKAKVGWVIRPLIIATYENKSHRRADSLILHYKDGRERIDYVTDKTTFSELITKQTDSDDSIRVINGIDTLISCVKQQIENYMGIVPTINPEQNDGPNPLFLTCSIYFLPAQKELFVAFYIDLDSVIVNIPANSIFKHGGWNSLDYRKLLACAND